jgi:hypothetical protein
MRFYTNAPESDREIYVQAAKATMFEIEVSDKAVDNCGESLGKGYIAVFMCGLERDTGSFFAEVERLRALRSVQQ